MRTLAGSLQPDDADSECPQALAVSFIGRQVGAGELGLRRDSFGCPPSDVLQIFRPGLPLGAEGQGRRAKLWQEIQN